MSMEVPKQSNHLLRREERKRHSRQPVNDNRGKCHNSYNMSVIFVSRLNQMNVKPACSATRPKIAPQMPAEAVTNWNEKLIIENKITMCSILYYYKIDAQVIPSINSNNFFSV